MMNAVVLRGRIAVYKVGEVRKCMHSSMAFFTMHGCMHDVFIVRFVHSFIYTTFKTRLRSSRADCQICTRMLIPKDAFAC